MVISDVLGTKQTLLLCGFFFPQLKHVVCDFMFVCLFVLVPE